MKYILFKQVLFRPVLISLMLLITANLVGQRFQNVNEEKSTPSDSSLINVAYGSIPLWKSTQAINTIKGDELRRSTSSSLSNALYGRIPGLTVLQGNGEPGYDSPELFIRGVSSYRQNNILTFVDGFESTFDQLVIDEIESITILKDAAATALYGIRGANGILLVTTKKGVIGAPKINFSAQTGLQYPTRLPKPLDAYNYARLYNEALTNEGKPVRYTDSDIAAYQAGNDPYFHPNVNWYNEVLKNSAPVSNYNLNFRGGNERARYFVLLNIFQNSGLYANTDPNKKENSNAHFLKYNFRSNISVNITNKLNAKLNLGGRVEDRSSPGGIGAGELFNKLLLTPPNAFPVYNPDGTYGGNSIYTNPVANVLSTGIYNDHTRDFQAIFRLNYNLDVITKGLSLDGAISFSNYFSGISSKTRTFAMYELSRQDNDTIYHQIGQDTPLSGNEGYNGQWRRSTTQFTLDYSRVFGEHEVDGTALFLRDMYVIHGNNVPFAYENLAGRFIYAFRKRYIGQLALSYSGTDNFPKSERHGFFPAFSLGWIVSEENFGRDAKWMDYLKIKASYGVTGNDQIGGQRFMYFQNFYQEGGYNFGNNNSFFPGYMEGNLANNNVTWETRRTGNIGIEALLFKNLGIDLDLFNETRYDILASPVGTVPGFLGVALPTLNEGKVRNRGFELHLKYSSSLENPFHYFVEGSAFYAKNRILIMSESAQPYEYLKQTGRSVGQPFGLVADGFYDESDFDTDGKLKAGLPIPQFGPVQPGDLKYKNQNDDQVIDVYDYQPIGRSNVPEWSFGFRTGFKYKGFDFDAFLQAVTNRTVYLNGPIYWAFKDNSGITSFALNRWTPETASIADYPRLSTTENENNYRLSDFWQRDGSFIKLRMVEVGYSLPSSLIQFTKLSGVRVFVNGNNLLSIDHIKFADPETLSGYPSLKSFNLGLEIKL